MIISKFKIQNSYNYKEPSEILKYFNLQRLFTYYKFESSDYQKYKNNPNYNLVNTITNYQINSNMEESLQKMLSWYIHPNDARYVMNREMIKTGKIFLQKFFNWKIILEKITLFVYKSIHKDTNLKQVNFDAEISKLKEAIEKKQDIIEIFKNYSDLNARVIYSLIQETESLINDINKELNPYRFQINQHATGIFHETVLV